MFDFFFCVLVAIIAIIASWIWREFFVRDQKIEQLQWRNRVLETANAHRDDTDDVLPL